MTAPTKSVRDLTYLRDGFRCVACGSHDLLEWNHREASGHGGRGRKAPKLTPADGVTLCTFCNQGLEADGQDRGLALGWKLRRNRGRMQSCEIPYYDTNDRVFYLPSVTGERVPVNPNLAQELLEASGNLNRKDVA